MNEGAYIIGYLEKRAEEEIPSMSDLATPFATAMGLEYGTRKGTEALLRRTPRFVKRNPRLGRHGPVALGNLAMWAPDIATAGKGQRGAMVAGAGVDTSIDLVGRNFIKKIPIPGWKGKLIRGGAYAVLPFMSMLAGGATATKLGADGPVPRIPPQNKGPKRGSRAERLYNSYNKLQDTSRFKDPEKYLEQVTNRAGQVSGKDLSLEWNKIRALKEMSKRNMTGDYWTGKEDTLNEIGRRLRAERNSRSGKASKRI